MFTSKLLPRPEASIPQAVGKSSPEPGTPDVALLEYTVLTRPTAPPPRAACWCLLLLFLPGHSPRASLLSPLQPSCPPWKYTPVSCSRPGEVKAESFLSWVVVVIRLLDHAQLQFRTPTRSEVCVSWALGCFPAVCLCLWFPHSQGGGLWEQSQLSSCLNNSHGVEDLCSIHWLSPDLPAYCRAWLRKVISKNGMSPQLLLSYDLHHFSLKLSTYS